MENIVVIGAGFAGLNFIKHIDKKKYNVMVVDRNNFNCFPPLFYQIASSGLAPSNICFPLRRELKKHPGTSYHMGHVKNLDLEKRVVTTSYETLHYDKLVIAAGTTNNFFGMTDLDKNVFCMKSVAEACHLRDEILDRLERGAICQNKERRRQLLSFLVVGGGPAGVEIAGALGDMKREVIPREYPELDPGDINITLVEGSDRILGAMSRKSSEKGLQYLKDLGIEIRLNTVMAGYKDKHVSFAYGHEEYWETVIWTAGVCATPVPGMPQSCLGHAGRIKVNTQNAIIGFENSAFAIGDIALMQTVDYPKGHPQVAQVAIQQGKNLARNFNDPQRDSPFKYRDKGSMATIGKARAVADFPELFFCGFSAWMAWLFIHLISIMGMHNKINVLMNWIWNYLNYSTSLRLLLRPSRFPMRRHWGD